MSEKRETPDENSSNISGNASLEIKESVSVFVNILINNMDGRGFAHNVGRRLLLREISFLEKAEEQQRMEGRVVAELTVDGGKSNSVVMVSLKLNAVSSDMVNPLGNMHGGCTAYLIDM